MKKEQLKELVNSDSLQVSILAKEYLLTLEELEKAKAKVQEIQDETNAAFEEIKKSFEELQAVKKPFWRFLVWFKLVGKLLKSLGKLFKKN